MAIEHAAAAIADIRSAGMLSIPIAGWQVLLIALGADILAVEDRCTHQDTPLCGGRIRNGRIACPRHGAMFDLRTGRSSAPIAPRPVHVFPVRIDGETAMVALPVRETG